jgi:hypothetical protein
MASQTVHYRQIVTADSGSQKFQQAIKSAPHKYDAKKGVGFLMSQLQSLKGFSARLIYPKTIKAKKVDPDDLTSFDFLSEEWQVNFATDIEFDFARKMAMVTGSRSGFKVFEDKIADIETVGLHFADLEIDVVGLLYQLQTQYKSTSVQSLAVKGYVDPNAYKANANFKADLKAAQTDDFIAKNSSKIHTVQVQVMQPTETYSIKFNKKGSVTFSAKGKDGVWPDYLYGYMADLLKHFNSIKLDSPVTPEPEVEGEATSHLKLVTGVAS